MTYRNFFLEKGYKVQYEPTEGLHTLLVAIAIVSPVILFVDSTGVFIEKLVLYRYDGRELTAVTPHT